MRIVALGPSLVLLSAIASAEAQTSPQMGVPPPDAEALASGPKGPAEAPKIEKPKTDSTSVTLSAGGLLTTGNSRTVALTLNGAFDLRRGNNGFGVYVLGNYGEAAPDPDTPMAPSAENVQGRVRYDRYLSDRMSLFLIGTGRYDKFQGLAFRMNLDPGFKYIIYRSPRTALWAEGGYDFLYDVRTEAGRVKLDDDGNPTGDLFDKTRTDHSARMFWGLRHAFTADITFSAGIEYLQSFIKTDLGTTNSRYNANAVLAAKLFKGFSVGIGCNAAYDRLPIPGRQQLDTTTTLSLIYGWSDGIPDKKTDKPKCPVCPEVQKAPASGDPGRAPDASDVPAPAKSPLPEGETTPPGDPSPPPPTAPEPANPAAPPP